MFVSSQDYLGDLDKDIRSTAWVTPHQYPWRAGVKGYLYMQTPINEHSTMSMCSLTVRSFSIPILGGAFILQDVLWNLSCCPGRAISLPERLRGRGYLGRSPGSRPGSRKPWRLLPFIPLWCDVIWCSILPTSKDWLPSSPRTLALSRMLSMPRIFKASLRHLSNPSACAFVGIFSEKYLAHDLLSWAVLSFEQ